MAFSSGELVCQHIRTSWLLDYLHRRNTFTCLIVRHRSVIFLLLLGLADIRTLKVAENAVHDHLCVLLCREIKSVSVLKYKFTELKVKFWCNVEERKDCGSATEETADVSPSRHCSAVTWLPWTCRQRLPSDPYPDCTILLVCFHSHIVYQSSSPVVEILLLEYLQNHTIS